MNLFYDLFYAQFPLMVLAILIALVVSLFNRDKPWVLFIWPFPVLACLGTTLLLWKRFGFASGGGDSGFGVLSVMFLVLPAMAMGLAGLAFCNLCRPRKAAWKLKTVGYSLITYIALIIAGSRWNETRVDLHLIDTAGKPVSGALVVVERNEDSGSKGKLDTIRTDDEGHTHFIIRKRQSAEISIQPVSTFPQSTSLATEEIHIRSLSTAPQNLIVRHIWKNAEGNQSLTKMLTRRWVLPITITVHSKEPTSTSP